MKFTAWKRRYAGFCSYAMRVVFKTYLRRYPHFRLANSKNFYQGFLVNETHFKKSRNLSRFFFIWYFEKNTCPLFFYARSNIQLGMDFPPHQKMLKKIGFSTFSAECQYFNKCLRLLMMKSRLQDGCRLFFSAMFCISYLKLHLMI